VRKVSISPAKKQERPFPIQVKPRQIVIQKQYKPTEPKEVVENKETQTNFD